MNEKIIFDYIDMMAERTADKLMKKLSAGGNNVVVTDSEWIDAKAAAKLIGVTPIYLRSIKSKFSYKKVGGNERGRVLFNRKELMDYYLNNK